MSWSNATITNKGYALQGKLLSTDKLNITRIVSGAGKVVAGQLVNQTDVTDIKQTLILEALSYNESGEGVIKVSLNNTELTESYTCHQIGIFATDPDEGEILYAILQADKGEDIPSISEQPAGYYCGWVLIIGFGDASGISVTIDPANALTIEAGDARYLPLSKEALVVNITYNSDTYETITDSDKTYEEVVTAVSEGKSVYMKAVNDKNTVTHILPLIWIESSYISFGACWGRFLQQGALTKNNKASISDTVLVGATMSGDLLEKGVNIGLGDNDPTGAFALTTGDYTKTTGDYAFAAGYGTVAGGFQTVVGRNNDHSTTQKQGVASESSTIGSLFVVGTGKGEDNRANGFRVTATGATYAGSSQNATGADGSEFKEWADGNPNNEDRIGHFVTFDGRKIRKATAADDYILGVVSDVDIAAFVGGNYADNWQGRWLKDVFGRRIIEEVHVEAYTDKNGKEHPARTDYQLKENPEFDPSKTYIPREERSEWAVVTVWGEIVIIDDGTCQVNGYAKPNDDGIGTAAEGMTDFRVLERIDESHVLVFHKR